MILTVEEVRALAPDLDASDALIEFRLKGIEQYIKGETCNDFERFRDHSGAIQWPDDIKLGVLNMLIWDDEGRSKAGIASETISRHSVSYTGLTEAESKGGYPAYLLGFLDAYRRARF